MKNLLIEQSVDDYINGFLNTLLDEIIPQKSTLNIQNDQNIIELENHQFNGTYNNYKPLPTKKSKTKTYKKEYQIRELPKYYMSDGFKIRTEQIERYDSKYTYGYFLTITFENRHNKKEILKDILKKLPKDSIFVNFLCGTHRKFKHNNEHKRKQHSHILIFTDTEIEEIEVPHSKLDIDFKQIFNLHYLLMKYILDGHHIIKDYYIKIKKSVQKTLSLREQIKRLRISSKISPTGFINKAVSIMLQIPTVSRPPT